VPALGGVPVNILAVVGFFILGFGHPGFWLLGLGLELAFLFSLATHPRFQKWVDAAHLAVVGEDTAAKRGHLVKLLETTARQQLSSLEGKCQRILDVYHSSQREDYLTQSNVEALQKLQWMYLKLLVAQHHLQTPGAQASEEDLRGKIQDLQKALHGPVSTESAKESKAATLKILEQRLVNLQRREQSLDEIASDLTRIEAQVDLALDQAAIEGQPISSNIGLVSQLLDSGLYGEASQVIEDIEQTYGAQTSDLKRQTQPLGSQ
jgi:hypothetical protein